MLIPLDHLSRRARSDVYRLSKESGYYPLIATHSRFDAIMHPDDRTGSGTHEYMLTEDDVDMIRQTGGVFGLRTGENPMLEVPKCLNKAYTCLGSSESLAQNVCWGARTGVAMSLGTDINTGPIAMTAPRFASTFEGTFRHDGIPAACPRAVEAGWVTASGYRAAFRDREPATRGARWTQKVDFAALGAGHAPFSQRVDEKWSFDVRGLAHIGYARDLLDDMGSLGAPLEATGMYRSAETLLLAWERTYSGKSRKRLTDADYRQLMGTFTRSYAAPDPKAAPKFDKELRKAFIKESK